ncbi:tetratricopeptide repeat domain protein [Rhodobacterales bacterium Y4I]|nr:tetratricopeptide repeat domain protein [Rhodobacterales bacterium Y4I]
MNQPLMHDTPAQHGASALEAASELVKAGKYGKALPLLLVLLRQDPSNVRVLDLTATCYLEAGDSRTAVRLLELLADGNPALPQAWGKLAAVRATSGDKAGAVRAFEQALSLAPGDVGLLAARNRLEPFTSDSSAAARLRAAVQNTAATQRERILAHFALGVIEDRAGAPAAAFDHYAQANALTETGYDLAFQDARLQAQLAADWTGAACGEAADAPRMLFVTGLPRSGTTLLETCLTRHSQIDSIGESEALSKTAAAVRRYAAGRYGDAGWWNWLGRLSAEELEQFRTLFLHNAFPMGKPDAAVVVDKMPLNCFEMGLAHVLLPNARFLFLSRHPLDVGLSIFTMNFAAGHRYSSRLEWIGHMTRCVYGSLLDYQAKLGETLRVQSFEALVTGPEAQIRSVLQHAGLGWEEGCLTPEQNTRAVRTASLMQVRDRINTAGLEKWRRYEAQLEPLKEALGGQAWIDQWQQWDRNAAETGSLAPAAA